MKKLVIGAVVSAFLVAGCTVGFVGGHGGRGDSLVIVPVLPETVELDNDSYYSQNGYYYRYQGDVWVYSSSREGRGTSCRATTILRMFIIGIMTKVMIIKVMMITGTIIDSAIVW